MESDEMSGMAASLDRMLGNKNSMFFLSSKTFK